MSADRRSNEKRRLVFLFILALFVFSPGCLPPGKAEKEPVETARTAPPPPKKKESPWVFLWVKTHRANLREGPGKKYLVITPIVKGARLIVLGKQGQWYLVNLRSASINGWIHESVVSDKEVPREE